MERAPESEIEPIARDVFLAHFPRYIRAVARLRHLPYERCRREAEDIRSEGLLLYLEARRDEAAAEADPIRLRRLAVRSLARACYAWVERSLRRPTRALPHGLRARGARPEEALERREMRGLVRRAAPEIGEALLRPDCLHHTGRLNKTALHRMGRVSRRKLESELRGVRRLLDPSSAASPES